MRWLRRKLGRTHWTARLLGIEQPEGEAHEPGLIMIQLDGLARSQFERAMAEGNLPFLARLMSRQHFSLETFYSGIPSTTPAVQGEIFFGVRTAVPAFSFLRRETGAVLRMNEAEASVEIGGELARRCPRPLLEGAHTYSNIYRAGAARSHYCAEDLAPDEILKRLHPLKWLVLSVLYAPKILRMLGLAALEAGLAVVDACRGLYSKYNFWKELLFVPTRILVCILLREMIRFRVLLDIERGVQTIHANFLGYDEQAHRRGPDAAFAHWTLKGIDRAVRDMFRASQRSDYRDYEFLIYSDHGQERGEPFVKRTGRELDAALSEVFSRGPLKGRELWMRKLPELVGNTLDHCRNLFGWESLKSMTPGEPDPSSQIIITAMGPLGHVYLPVQPDAAEMEEYARAMVADAGVPLVLLRARDGKARAFNRRGTWELPADGAEVLGAKHPFLKEAAQDMVGLCAHPDAGDFIISGWDPELQPLSFPIENGSHGGPGSEETRGFLLVPDRIHRWHLAHLKATRSRVRGEELHQIARHFLGREGSRAERAGEAPGHDATRPLRVMTYNIHSCIGMDGKVRPERIARVINHCDPDIVAVQEIDAHRPRTKGHDQAQVIADHLRMSHAFHAMFEEEKERYGIAIFARFPFKVLRSGYLTPPGRGREGRGAIWVRVALEGRPPFHVINTHFGLGRDERLRQVRELLGPDWLGGIPRGEPVVLCGDFNSGPRSEVCRRLRERLADVQYTPGGLRWRATFPSVTPVLRLDHVFASDHFTVEHIERPHSLTAAVASDHLPLCVELSQNMSHANP